VLCQQCASESPEDAKFCVHCGAALSHRCPACGTAHEATQKFCGECGRALSTPPPLESERAPDAAAPPVDAGAADLPRSLVVEPAPELRLVSVLFVDIVGYTNLSESRDAEEVRDLLSRYFDTARTIIERYAGTLEKFIGDAVMAVWGAPVAREDDAERAVRAGLELVDAVAALGAEVGTPELRARGGIVTGQAASLDRVGEGLVVGDRVNTAARTQSAAEPGTVYVDAVTREASSRAIAYADAGEHVVKGKAEPLQLWRALRTVAGLGGAQRERGLEPPMLGRDHDLRLLKELFHGALKRRGAHLVAISGEPGVGKSRLLWEFDKYADGLAERLLWHSGRCLADDDGIAYWALAEAVRQRLSIPQEASAEEIEARMAEGLARWVPDAGDRDFLWPRLGVLLGLGDPGLARAELFAGWRMFLERLADDAPVVLVLEDLQWAGEGLLDFIDHVLDWSSASPIFIVTLARPHIAARSQGWPAARRGAASLQLDPIGDEQMGTLLEAIVTELPSRLRAQIVSRAEGVPLYAMETLRVLVSRGSLKEREGRLHLVGELGDLDVPATLSALVASRLDALAPLERRLVRAMAVFGGGFPRIAAAELAGVPSDALDETLAGLVRKQVLTIGSDPLSPDRGQYRFSQTLLRTVAYEMLSRRERGPRHRAAAEYLRRAFPNDGEDVAEAVAAHYLGAYHATRDADESAELRAHSIASLRRAAQRAAAIGAPETAKRAYHTAAELCEEPQERLGLIRLAGEMALRAGHIEEALELFGKVVEGFRSEGRSAAAAGAAALIGETLHRLERNEEAIEIVVAALPDASEGADVAALNAVLGRARSYIGDIQGAEEPLALALGRARELHLPLVESKALTDMGVNALQEGDPERARMLLEEARDTAEAAGLAEQVILAVGNIANIGMQWDRPEAADQYAEQLALSRRSGDRLRESLAASNLSYILLLTGRWDEIEALATKLLTDLEDRPGAEFVYSILAIVQALRGRREAARASLAKVAAWERGDDEELRAMHAAVRTSVLLADGQAEQALDSGTAMLPGAVRSLGAPHDAVRNGWPDTFEAALQVRRLDDARALVTLLERQQRLPAYLDAHLSRARGLLATATGGDPDLATSALAEAGERFEKLGYPYWAARTQGELAVLYAAGGRTGQADDLLQTARATLLALGAQSALARIDAAARVAASTASERRARLA
jgi:class 3 adenylate cyclase/tetratricopeptide (TPR) repeat protein